MDSMTLQSNASRRLYPKNVPGHFINQLPKYIDYEGEYGAGIGEIFFSLRFKNLQTLTTVVDGKQKKRNLEDEDNGEAHPVKKLKISTDGDGGSNRLADVQQGVVRSRRSIPFSISPLAGVNPPTPIENEERSKSVEVVAKLDDPTQTARDGMIRLRNQYLSAYEGLSEVIRNCSAHLRQSTLLEEVGEIIANKFKESIDILKSEENKLSIYLSSMEMMVHNQEDTGLSDVFADVQSKVLEISHKKDHLLVEFLDFVKVLQGEKKREVEEVVRIKDIEKNYWKNNFIGLSYSAFSDTREMNDSYIPKYLYVYCNLVEKRLVGDVFSPLLRVVRIPPIRKNGDTARVTYENPHFVRLEKHSFDSVEILIRDEKGNPVAFEDGLVIITLQFKKLDY